jgi:hypothetical protein
MLPLEQVNKDGWVSALLLRVSVVCAVVHPSGFWRLEDILSKLGQAGPVLLATNHAALVLASCPQKLHFHGSSLSWVDKDEYRKRWDRLQDGDKRFAGIACRVFRKHCAIEGKDGLEHTVRVRRVAEVTSAYGY